MADAAGPPAGPPLGSSAADSGHGAPRRAWAPPSGRAPIAVALDAPDGPTALRWARWVAPHAAVLKIGMELFFREGPAIVNTLRDEGLLVPSGSGGGPGPVCARAGQSPTPRAGGAAAGEQPAAPGAPELFLDLKLHDIPATVAGGIRSVARLAPRFVTVHAAGGTAMIRAAVEAAGEAGGGSAGPLDIAAVTVLTSLDEAALAAVGLAGPPADAVRRLAVLAVSAGAKALVCSPKEVRMVREELGNDVTLITPGVRPVGSDQADQARTATPGQALADGADLLVIGRPITSAPDPAARAAAVAASLLSPL